MYRVVLTRRAEKSLAKSPKQIQEKFAIAITALQNSFAPFKNICCQEIERLRKHLPNPISQLAYHLRNSEKRRNHNNS